MGAGRRSSSPTAGQRALRPGSWKPKPLPERKRMRQEVKEKLGRCHDISQFGGALVGWRQRQVVERQTSKSYVTHTRLSMARSPQEQHESETFLCFGSHSSVGWGFLALAGLPQNETETSLERKSLNIISCVSLVYWGSLSTQNSA